MEFNRFICRKIVKTSKSIFHRCFGCVCECHLFRSSNWLMNDECGLRCSQNLFLYCIDLDCSSSLPTLRRISNDLTNERNNLIHLHVCPSPIVDNFVINLFLFRCVVFVVDDEFLLASFWMHFQLVDGCRRNARVLMCHSVESWVSQERTSYGSLLSEWALIHSCSRNIDERKNL